MPVRFDLVILDLDGTLVDSERLLVGLVNETLLDRGCARADERAIASAIGLPLEDVFRRALGEADHGLVADLCIAYRRRADTPDFVRQFRLYPGIREGLEQLRSAGVRLAIATSKSRATTGDIVRHCGIDDLLDLIAGGDSVRRGKPHPEMIHHVCTLSDLPPHRTLMVGDTSFDMQMAQAAGAASCAVTYGMHTATSLRALHPDFIIDRFAALADCIGVVR